jgi:hypothetical protein
MKGARPYSWIKKLAKVNMPSILSGLGKGSKLRKFVLEMDNYYDMQRPKKNNKVSKAVTFLIVHGFEWWTSKNAY